MKKRFLAMFLLTILVVSVAFTTHAALQQHALSEKMIRLHVVANSDTPEDQSRKLQVRDAVLARVSQLTADCTDVAQASARLRENLSVFERAARQTLQAVGDSSPVTVTLARETFPTRAYDTFTLPAGEYLSLRVSIGQAAGHNWWCVVFPSLCTAATTADWEEAAAAAQFSQEEQNFITGGEEQYVLKFKVLEWLQKLLS